MRVPVVSLTLPSPTASTLPFCGFSFAVSGRTIPEAVVASSSTALTIRRSPSGLSFIGRSLRWHAGKKQLALAIRECQRTTDYTAFRRAASVLPGIAAQVAIEEALDQLERRRGARDDPLAVRPDERPDRRGRARPGLEPAPVEERVAEPVDQAQRRFDARRRERGVQDLALPRRDEQVRGPVQDQERWRRRGDVRERVGGAQHVRVRLSERHAEQLALG